MTYGGPGPSREEIDARYRAAYDLVKGRRARQMQRRFDARWSDMKASLAKLWRCGR